MNDETPKTDEIPETDTPEGEDRSRYIGLGIIFGTVVGVALDNVGLWIALGLVFGAAYAQTKAKSGSDDGPENI